MTAPWWPMVEPPLPGADLLRRVCRHGYTDEACAFEGPEHDRERAELPADVLEQLADFDGIEPWWADQPHDAPKRGGVRYPMIQSRSWWATE